MTKRRICILGGCGGIGRSLVAASIDAGDDVAVLDLKVALDRHTPPASTLAIDVDASDEASISKAFGIIADQWGALDGFVNCVGFMMQRRNLIDTPVDEFDTVSKGNIRSTFLAAKFAMPLLLKGNEPSFVNITSGLGAHIRPQYGPYAAAKAAMIAMTKSLAHEHAPKVRVNAVGPGAVDTAFLRGGTGRSNEDQSPSMDVDAYAAMIPMKRIGVVSDIAGPVMFLLGPQSAYMTGQTLWVNGGAYMP
jgi:NAD(P)-dependent dehydrogenase (short-subunit alcohol dehydrogenase family)